jgi:hypothetical protein
MGGTDIMLTRIIPQPYAKHFLLALALLAGPPGCRQHQQPAPAQPPVQSPATASQPQATQPQPPTTSQAASQPASQLHRFTVTALGSNPDQPLAILSKIDPKQPARISASLQSDHFLTIETANVSFIQIDLFNLPRREAGRLVIRIDTQGLEVTGRAGKIVYLQRNAVGNWSFTKAPHGQ